MVHDPHALAAADGLVDVEGDGLVLGLLEGVPQEQVRAPRRGRTGRGSPRSVRTSSASVAVKCSRAAVAARLDFGGSSRSRMAEAPLGEPLEALGRVAELGEAVVERPVLAAVHRLLADEAGDLALELRVGDLVAVVAHRADEEVLAVGEHRRQRRRRGG